MGTAKSKIVEPSFGHMRRIRMGLGDAIRRLVAVEKLHMMGVHDIPDRLIEERDLIVQAMNQIELDLGFDCNNDGVPDTIDIFEATASTSCCRILPHDTSRRKSSTGTSPKAPASTTRRRRGGSSRRKKT